MSSKKAEGKFCQVLKITITERNLASWSKPIRQRFQEEVLGRDPSYLEVFFTDIKGQSLGGNDLRRTVSKPCFMEPGVSITGRIAKPMDTHTDT